MSNMLGPSLKLEYKYVVLRSGTFSCKYSVFSTQGFFSDF